jgi:hypothetical protein
MAKRALIGSRIRVEATRGPNDATRHVRHEVYCVEKGFLTPDTLFDCYDQRAIILNAFDGSEPVGTMRITDSADGRLELFEVHPELETLVPAGLRYVELSRLMVVRRCRDLRATLPLFQEAIFATLASHDGFLLGCAEGLIPYFSRLFGFRLLSTQPLVHGPLRGLVGYPMFGELTDVLTHLTAPVWLALSPSVFAHALGIRTTGHLGGLLSSVRSRDGALPTMTSDPDARAGLRR